MPSPLVIRDLTVSYSDRPVLDGVDLAVHPGQRVGLVGENGAGKSTLLRVVAGLLPHDGGELSIPSDLGYLAQDGGLDERATVGDVLREALAPLHEAVTRLEVLAARLEVPEAVSEYDALLGWAQLHQAWAADRRSEVAAQRLGLEALAPDRPVAELSGGQRTRLALAALLTRQPECLVLDEPTNHLDDQALEFLEGQLTALPGVVLAASHDRVFLDRVCTAVVDLDPAHFGTDGVGGRRHGGAYTGYLHHKRESRRRWAEAFEAQRAELAELRATASTTALDVAHGRPPRDNDKFVHRFKGSRVQTAARRRARNAEQRLTVLERDPIPKPPEPLTFSGSFDADGAGHAQVRGVEVAGRLRLERLDVAPGEKVLLTGPNGCGKSTLLAVLAGCLRPDSGQVDVFARQVGLLAQDVVFAHPSRTGQELFASAAPQRSLSALGLVRPADAARPVGELSQGQQRRLALAVLLAGQPDLVLLDEPTNHLSLSLVEELEEALHQTSATVVVASHDRWLRQRWPGTTVAITPAPVRRSAAR